MSTIEDNSATARVPISVLAWMESSNHREDEKGRNMINIHLVHEKSMIEHRSNNVPCPVENVVHAQPSVSHEEDEIQNSSFEHVPSKRPGEDPEEDDRKPAAKELKRSQKMMLRVSLRMSHKKKPHLSPGKTRRTMKLCSGSIYLLEMMVKIIMMWLIWKKMPKEQ